MKWWHISIILCAYGFFKEFRPSEPFITPYLTTFKNLTIEQVNEEMFPVGTYCYMSLLIVIFLLTDYLRYKPVLLVGSISGVITWSILIWGTTMTEMQVVEFFYGLFLASEVAYYTYMYAKVDKKHYQKVTSHTRAAILVGKATAGLFSQVLVYLKINYLQLNYFSVFGVGITIPLAFFLPAVPQSIYFHRKESGECETDNSNRQLPFFNEVQEEENERCSSQVQKSAFSRLYTDFKQAYTNIYVLKWSVWWALASCGYLQAISYCQLLWEDIMLTDKVTLYHGIVEFAYAVTSAAVAFGVGYIKIKWNIWGEIILGVLTIIQGCLLYYSAYLTSLYVAYIVSVLYRDVYEAAITVVTFEVAKCISKDSYGLIFGINIFVALVAQTILTIIVLGTLQISIRPQYQIYGGYHFAIGCAFLIYGLLRLCYGRKNAVVSSRALVLHKNNEFL